jgi:hypothetical protein
MYSSERMFSLTMPGAFIDDDDERWWEVAPPGFLDEPAFPSDSGAFQEYDAALWENAPTFFNHIPGTSDSTQEKDIVIAVMGVTGAGKSTFIKTVSGRDDVIVGDSLSSGSSILYTSEILHS